MFAWRYRARVVYASTGSPILYRCKAPAFVFTNKKKMEKIQIGFVAVNVVCACVYL